MCTSHVRGACETIKKPSENKNSLKLLRSRDCERRGQGERRVKQEEHKTTAAPD